jgi:hypothetical protein
MLPAATTGTSIGRPRVHSRSWTAGARMAAAPSKARRQPGRRSATGAPGAATTVMDGCSAAARSRPGRRRTQRRSAPGRERPTQRDHAVRRIGGQQGGDRQPQQPEGGRSPAAATEQAHQEGQQHDVGQGQEDGGELLVEGERRVAGVGDHQELPGHHPETDGDHERIQQRTSRPRLRARTSRSRATVRIRYATSQQASARSGIEEEKSASPVPRDTKAAAISYQGQGSAGRWRLTPATTAPAAM